MLIAHLLQQMHSGAQPHASPAPANALPQVPTGTVSGPTSPAGRTPLVNATRGGSSGGARQPLHNATSRTAHASGFGRIESPPTSAASAYMSTARRIPAPGIGSHDISWSKMVRPGAGNFGMK